MFKHTLRLAVLGAAAVGVVGCKVDQKAEVARYRKVLDATSPPAPEFREDQPLTLAEAMSLANANNEQLARGGEDYVQAIITKSRAVAAFLPTLTFQPSYSVIESPGGTQPAGTSPGGGTSVTPGVGGGGATGTVTSGATGYRHFAGTSNILHRFEAPLVGSINLFRAGADLSNLRAAESNIEARRLLLLDLQATTLLSVAESYYAVLRSERSVAVLTDSLRLQEARLADVKQQFVNGLATRLTVAQSQAQAEGTRATLLQAQGDLANARSTLALVVGVPAVTGPLVDGYVPPAELPPLAQVQEAATKERADLAAAVAFLDVARSGVNVAFAQYYPSVSLNVSGFLYREYYGDASKWSSVLSANLPIFSGGLIQADVRAAWSRLRQAALDESYLRRSILSAVAISYQNFITADRRLVALQDQVAAAEEALRQSRTAFANSLATNLDVLTAQDQLQTAELQRSNAAFDRTVFYLDLLRQTGELTGNGMMQAQITPAAPRPAPATQPIYPTTGP